MAYSCTEEERRLQRCLIPVNIVVCILCLVAMISLLTAPLIRLDFGKLISATYDLAKEELSQDQDDPEEEASIGSYAEEEAPADSGDKINKDSLLDALTSIDIKMTITVAGLGKAAFAKGDKTDALIDSLFGENAYEKIFVPALTTTVAGLIRGGTGIALEEANTILMEIGDVHSKEEFDAKTEEWISKIEEESGEPIAEEDRQKIKEEMSEAYDKASDVTTGEFNLEKFICTAVGDSMGYEDAVTSYEELGKMLLKNSGGGSVFEEYSDLIGKLTLAIFLFLLFFVLVWFVLFLFSFFHLFSANKRFMMWYVKLFGGLPAVVFWFVPIAAGKAIEEAFGATVAGLFAAYSSLAWISGLCYVLLWFVSICWAFPIKHQIRKLRKQG